MSKEELMKQYTAEQLAEMVIINQTKIDELLRQEKTIHNYTIYLQSKLGDMEYEINKRQKAIEQIDRIIYELFGIAHNEYEYADDFKKLLKEKLAVEKTITDFLPIESIKVADMLIKNAMHEPCANILSFGKPYSLYDMSELRQIAEHLLAYCNHNGGAEE